MPESYRLGGFFGLFAWSTDSPCFTLEGGVHVLVR
jgi:hypothetical protein